MSLLPYSDALAKLQRAFPDHDITIHDGDENTESGLVESHGEKVASFRLTLREHPAHELPLVSQIRVGAVGQFCGTAAEIAQWEQSASPNQQSAISNPQSPVYLDYNATTPLDPRVLAAMLPWLGVPANAGSRTHEHGRRAKEALEQARAHVAAAIAAPPEEIVFTSGATESNNLALLGLARWGEESQRRHILSTAIEHKAVLEPLAQLAAAGFEVELAPVTAGGYVEAGEIARRLRPDTLLVSVMHANNETGVIQPVVEIGEQLAGTPTLFHVDAAQTFGKEVDQFPGLHVDLLSISGHKIYGPQGIGALRVRRRSGEPRRLAPLQFGGGQERGLRPGTTPVALAVGLGEAARLAGLEWRSRRAAALQVREQLLRELQGVEHRIHGDPARTQAHVLNVSFPGVDSEALLMSLRDRLSLSNGSACTSSSYQPSHVLVAMGLEEEEIESAVRISWGEGTMQSHIGSVLAGFPRPDTPGRGVG